MGYAARDQLERGEGSGEGEGVRRRREEKRCEEVWT